MTGKTYDDNLEAAFKAGWESHKSMQPSAIDDETLRAQGFKAWRGRLAEFHLPHRLPRRWLTGEAVGKSGLYPVPEFTTPFRILEVTEDSDAPDGADTLLLDGDGDYWQWSEDDSRYVLIQIHGHLPDEIVVADFGRIRRLYGAWR